MFLNTTYADISRASDLRDQGEKMELTLSELMEFSVFKGVMVTENVVVAIQKMVSCKAILMTWIPLQKL